MSQKEYKFLKILEQFIIQDLEDHKNNNPSIVKEVLTEGHSSNIKINKNLP